MSCPGCAHKRSCLAVQRVIHIKGKLGYVWVCVCAWRWWWWCVGEGGSCFHLASMRSSCLASQREGERERAAWGTPIDVLFSQKGARCGMSKKNTTKHQSKSAHLCNELTQHEHESPCNFEMYLGNGVGPQRARLA